MKKLLCLITLMFMVLIFCNVTSYADTSDMQTKMDLEKQILNTRNSEEEYIVKFKPSVSEDKKAFSLSGFNSKSVGTDNLGLVRISGKNALGHTIEEFKVKNSDDIEYIVPNYKRTAFLKPNDTYYSSQWNMQKINMERAWDITTGSSSVTVAVIDSGLNLQHTDIAHNIVAGHNFIFENSDIYDINGHGTFVTGIIESATNNSIGIAGTAWNVKIMPLQVTYGDGTIYDSDIIDAITYAVQNGADIINLSIGGNNYSSALYSAINYAISNNVVVIASAGNDGNNVLKYPAAFQGVIGVGSTNSSDTKSIFSQMNSSVDIVAPGEEILSTSITTSGYGIGSGTSFSAPLVSGVAALLLSVDPSLTPSQITNILQTTSTDLGTPGRDDYYGYGRIDASKALKSLLKPIGYIDTISNNQQIYGTVNIGGWFLDDKGVSKIEILVDGSVMGTATYGGTRNDVAAAYPGYSNSNSGFSYQLDTKLLNNGSHTITVRETSLDNNVTTLGNLTVAVYNRQKIGYIETISNNQQLSGTAYIGGWFLDEDKVSKIDIIVDGVVMGQAQTGILRQDVAAAYPQYNNTESGFYYHLDTKQLKNGSHTITIRETSNTNVQTSLPSLSVVVSNTEPFGYFDTITNNQELTGTVYVGGWFLDAKGVSKIEILVDDNVVGEATIGLIRTDVYAAFPEYNVKNSGFYYQLDTKKLKNGSHTITLRETGIGSSEQVTLKPLTVLVNNNTAIGYIDTIVNGQTLSDIVKVGGWFLDYSGVSKIEILIDGNFAGNAIYGGKRDDVAAAYPEYNNYNSGFYYQLDTKGLSNGGHTITVRETNSDSKQTSLPSLSVIVNNVSAIGYIDTITTNQQLSGIVNIGGWLLDKNGVSKIEILVDGNVVGNAMYGGKRDDVAAAYPEYNNYNSGFYYLLDTTKLINGNHTITVKETSNNNLVTILPSIIVNSNNIAPIGYVDSLSNNQQITGTVKISGWFLDLSGVNKIDIFIDNNYFGTAIYGDSRSDVYAAYPQYNNSNSGFHYNFDTSKVGAGTHTITIKEVGNNGSLKVLPSITVTVAPQPIGTWTTKASMATPRYGLGAVAYNGKIYAIGGTNSEVTAGKKIEEYNIASNSWSSKLDMDARRYQTTPLLINGKIYMVGQKVAIENSGVSAVVEEYNPTTDTWTFLSNIPNNISEFAVATLNGKIYIIGGSYNADLNSVYEYDLASNKWTVKANLPTARYGLKATAINGKILAIGGRHYGSNSYLNIVEEYDPTTDLWKTKTAMPTARESFGAVTVNGKVYAIGGYRSNTVEEYNPLSDTWKTLAVMPTARYNFGIAEYNGKIYIIGGDTSSSTNSIIGTVEEFTPPAN